MPAVKLLPYQVRWVKDRSRFKIGMQARQTGKTFGTTLEIVDDCFEVEAQGRRTKWVVLSRGERQAREAMQSGIQLHARAYNMAIQEFESEFLGESGTSYKCLETALPGGSRILALPANPDTARGFSANVFLDEFAFHKDSRAIWTALFPVISNGYKIRITSTPNGKGNKFYDLMTASDSIWSRHSVNIHQAVADGLNRNIDELRAALNDEDAWAQEFELAWLDEGSAWLDFDLINSAEHELAGLPDLYQGGLCYIGNDIGRRRDLWVAWVYERVGDVLWTREIRTLKRASFAEQDRVMDELFARYRVARLAMDQTGMGEKPVEDAKRRYGEHRVTGVLFTNQSKIMLGTIGKAGFEDRKVRNPQGDSQLRFDLHKIKKVPTGKAENTFTLEADRDSEGHADRAWACFLAQFAADEGQIPIEFLDDTDLDGDGQEI